MVILKFWRKKETQLKKALIIYKKKEVWSKFAIFYGKFKSNLGKSAMILKVFIILI